MNKKGIKKKKSRKKEKEVGPLGIAPRTIRESGGCHLQPPTEKAGGSC